MATALQSRVNVSLAFVVWVIIGVFVAAHEGFARFDNAEQAVQFALNVLVWPIPAFGGGIDVRF